MLNIYYYLYINSNIIKKNKYYVYMIGGFGCLITQIHISIVFLPPHSPPLTEKLAPEKEGRRF